MLIALPMSMDRPKSHHLIKRMIGPLTIWAVTKILETPAVKKKLQKVDAHAYTQKREAKRALRRAGRNAARNRRWLAAGAAAMAVGLGLMTKATRPK